MFLLLLHGSRASLPTTVTAADSRQSWHVSEKNKSSGGSYQAVKCLGNPHGVEHGPTHARPSQRAVFLCLHRGDPGCLVSSTDVSLTAQHLQFGGFHTKSWDFSFFWRIGSFGSTGPCFHLEALEASGNLGNLSKGHVFTQRFTYLYCLLGQCRPGID